jgi:pimeloyl-ACP methyl ester carboxylesterase
MNRWIFLRGLMRESRHWGDFPDIFRQQVSDVEVVLLDLPGNGQLHQLVSPSKVDGVGGMVACYRDLLSSMNIEPPYYLLALSLGAMAAVEWAHRYPDEVEGIVLINTSLRPFCPWWMRLRPRNYLAIAYLALFNRDVNRREQLIWHMTSARQHAEMTIVDNWVRYQHEQPVSTRNALAQLFAAARYRAPVQRPNTHILLLASAADQLVHPDCSRRIARQWQTALAMHLHAGHDLPLDDGVWAAMQVRDWLCRVNVAEKTVEARGACR